MELWWNTKVFKPLSSECQYFNNKIRIFWGKSIDFVSLFDYHLDDHISNTHEFWREYLASFDLVQTEESLANKNRLFNSIEGKIVTEYGLKSKQFKSFSKKLWSEGICEISAKWFNNSLSLSCCSNNKHIAAVDRLLDGKWEYNLLISLLVYTLNIVYANSNGRIDRYKRELIIEN